MGSIFEDAPKLNVAIKDFFHQRFDPEFPLEITVLADSAATTYLYLFGLSEIWYKSYYVGWGRETLLLAEVSGLTNRPRGYSTVQAYPKADIEVLRCKEGSLGWFAIWLRLRDRRLRLNFSGDSMEEGRRILAALTRPTA